MKCNQFLLLPHHTDNTDCLTDCGSYHLLWLGKLPAWQAVCLRPIILLVYVVSIQVILVGEAFCLLAFGWLEFSLV